MKLSKKRQLEQLAIQQHILLLMWGSKRRVFECWEANGEKSVRLSRLKELFGNLPELSDAATKRFNEIINDSQ